MTKEEIGKWIDLRDGKRMPESRQEMLELARFHFSSRSAGIDQSLQQRRTPKPTELREMEMEAVKKIIAVYEEWRDR